METRAITRFVRLSPRKVRLVVDEIRGKGVEEALNILKFVPKRSAVLVTKALRGGGECRDFSERGCGQALC